MYVTHGWDLCKLTQEGTSNTGILLLRWEKDMEHPGGATPNIFA